MVSPGIISIPSEFDSTAGVNPEFDNQLMGFVKDDHDDLLVAYAITAQPGPTDNIVTLFSYKWLCDY